MISVLFTVQSLEPKLLRMLSPQHKHGDPDTSLHLKQSLQYDFLLAIKEGDCCFEMHKVSFMEKGLLQLPFTEFNNVSLPVKDRKYGTMFHLWPSEEKVNNTATL